jgi:hypothetical protein
LPRDPQHPVPQLGLGLSEIDQLLGQRRDQLFQLRNDLAVQFLQESLLDGGESLCCTHGCT